MLISVALLLTVIFAVSGQDASQANKPLGHKEKSNSDRKSEENPIPVESLPMGAGTYQYYDNEGVLHIANYVNDMYGFRILSDYTPFMPLNTFSKAEKPKRAPKAKPRNKFNIETFDMFDEVEEKAPEPKKENSEISKKNATAKPINQAEEQYQSESSTISESVQEKKEFRGRMPSGTFKWPSYPTVMDMGGPKAMDSKYFYGPRVFFYENRPLPATFQSNDGGNSDITSTPEPPKDTTAAPATTTDKAEEPPASAAPSVSGTQFTRYFSINHSPPWAGRPAYPAYSTTGYSIRYGTRNVQPFAPSLTNLNKLWPELPRLGDSTSFGRIVQWGRV